MSRTIRVDNNLYKSIQNDAIAFEDTPNSVLIRWALDLGKLKNIQTETHIQLDISKLTKERELLIPVAEALLELGGKARAKDVTDLVILNLKPTPDDLRKLPSGPKRIEKQIHWARNTLTIKGVISSYSLRGMWELTKYGHNWLDDTKKK